MPNGVIKGLFINNDNNLRPEIHWSYSQNVNNRQTTITCTLKIYKKTSYGSTWNSRTPCKMTLNGQTLFNETKSLDCRNMSVGSYMTVGSFTKTVTHNDSGKFAYGGITGSMQLYGSIDFSKNNPGWGYVPSKGNTVSINIPDIPVSSNIDSISNNIYINGTNEVITNITLGLPSYTCEVTFSLGSSSYTITDSSTSSKNRIISYAIPKSWCNEITNSTSGNMIVTCKTYNGKTLIHTVSKTTTVLIPTDIVPTISSWDISSGNDYSVVDGVKYWLKGLSTMKVMATGNGSYGSEVSKIVISVPGQNDLTIVGSNGYIISNPLSVVGTNTIKATVYDSRGRSKSYSKSLNVTDYETPIISNLSMQRVSFNSDTNEYYPDEDSNIFKISFMPKAYKIFNNSCLVKLTCNDNTISFSSSSFNCTINTLYSTYVTINNYNPNNKYILRYTLTDNINNTYVFDYKLNPSAIIFSFNKSGKSIGIGIRSNLQGDKVGVEMCKDLFLGGNMQTDEEKNIYFYGSSSSLATNKHKCRIYGGDSESKVGIGIWDDINDLPVMQYYDSNKNLLFPNSSMEIGKEVTILMNGRGFNGADTDGNSVSLVNIDSDNTSKFGYGSYASQSQKAYDEGSEYMGGAYSALRSKKKVFLCCMDTEPSVKSAGKIEYYKDSNNNYVFRPAENGIVLSGSANFMWKTVYATDGIKTSSDRTKKENIKYLTYNINPNVEKENNLGSNDLFEFITKDYMLTTYNYIGDNKQKLSAIAQDIIYNIDGTDNEVGQLIVDCEEAVADEAGLSMNQTQLLNVTIGAFQQFVKNTENKTKELEEKILEQNKKIEKLEKLLIEK